MRDFSIIIKCFLLSFISDLGVECLMVFMVLVEDVWYEVEFCGKSWFGLEEYWGLNFY